MKIRLCRADEMSSVAKLHIDCFPDSFSTVFGKGNSGRLLEKYYREYYKESPALFFVAEEGGKIVGLCMGFICGGKNSAREFLKNNLLSVTFRMLRLLICGDEVAWKKIASLMKKTKEISIEEPDHTTYAEREHAEVLSLCVAAEYRGRGIADDLMNAFFQAVLVDGAKICGLTVRTENKRATAFYKKLGFIPRSYADDSVYMTKPLVYEEEKC